MKTDRELLELAARAAGIPIERSRLDDPMWRDMLVETSNRDEAGRAIGWNPLNDDGDALRLAVKLGFTVERGKCSHSPYGPAFGEDILIGEMKATRRAIVRAAAAIGEGMK